MTRSEQQGTCGELPWWRRHRAAILSVVFAVATAVVSNAPAIDIGGRDKAREARAEGWFPDRSEKWVLLFTNGSGGGDMYYDWNNVYRRHEDFYDTYTVKVALVASEPKELILITTWVIDCRARTMSPGYFMWGYDGDGKLNGVLPIDWGGGSPRSPEEKALVEKVCSPGFVR